MPLLEVDDISIHFGGVVAVKNLSFNIDAGLIYSVIGPNGAGKTTLFNLITGIYKPTSGKIRFDGQAIHGQSPNKLAERGIARTFQNLQICFNMTALENVMIGAHLRLDRNVLKAALRWPSLRRRDQKLRKESADLMKFVGLEKYLDARSDALSYGILKRLEIARALAMNPKMVFLDEPAAGLNPQETNEIEQLIRKLADSGITIVLVEHDMKMVMNLSDRILVLDYGKKLTEGTCAQVRQNPDVIAAYLGTHNPASPEGQITDAKFQLASSKQEAVLLTVSGLESSYGKIKVLKGLNFEVRRGETIALIGANGAGKTTLLRTLSGVQHSDAGEIWFDGENITKQHADQRMRNGICHSPEGRQIFGSLSVEDHLFLGAYTQKKAFLQQDIERVYALFPILKEKRKLLAGTLSGGQQQMLSIGRALMGRPKLLLLDEPSMGLAPLLVKDVFDVVRTLKAEGMTIILAEQNAFATLALSDRGYVMETGEITLTGNGQELIHNKKVRSAYLGM
jgi:branched-chain amino acid transport system ATP-binding protein